MPWARSRSRRAGMPWALHNAVSEATVNGVRQPPVSPRALRIATASSWVCSASSSSMMVNVSGGVVWVSQALSGRGTLIVSVCPPGETDVRGDVFTGLDQGYVVDQVADEAFAFPHRGSGVVEERGEVGAQCTDAGLLLGGEETVVPLAAPVVLLALGEVAELAVSSPLPARPRRAGSSDRRRG